MIPNNLWSWLFAPVVIFVWAGFEMVAYVEPFVARWIMVVLLWKLLQRSRDWRSW